MKISPKALFTGVAVLSMSLPALAGVNINSPSNDESVTSPFKLSASAATCSSKSVVSMGYSFDSSSSDTVFNSQSIDSDVSVAAGTHTIHIKAWASGGTVCVSEVTVNVKSGATSAASSDSSNEIPSNAQKVSDIQALSGWKASHDDGGSGSSSGSTSVVSSPSLYGSTREYKTSFSNSGDERYSVSFADDVDSQNFFYDAWVYLDSTSSKIANLEFDVNQVMADGKTVLVGVQCDGWTGKWDYTVNTGSASDVKPKWVTKSGTSCNPRSWKQGSWHHIQYNFSRDDSGNIQYKSVWLDGAESQLNVQAFGAADLGWGPVVQTQFQIDGYGSSGSAHAYLDKLVISRW